MTQRDVVREGYDEIAEVYDEERSAEGPERDIAEQFATDVSERLGGGTGLVLDAGCGAGRPVLETLAEQHDVVGLDISTGQLEHARRRVPGGGFVQGDLAHLPLDDDSVDAVASYHAIIHVPKDEHERVLSEFHRVLRPGGDALVVMGSDAWEGTNDGWLGTDTSMAWSFFGAERNREIVTDAGFEISEEWILDDELGGTFAIFRATA